MNPFHLKSLTIIALSAVSFSVFASSDDDSCTSEPKSGWMAIKDMQTALEKQGYKVRRIKREGSCYEVYTEDKDGRKLELMVDPVNGDIFREEKKS